MFRYRPAPDTYAIGERIVLQLYGFVVVEPLQEVVRVAEGTRSVRIDLPAKCATWRSAGKYRLCLERVQYFSPDQTKFLLTTHCLWCIHGDHAWCVTGYDTNDDRGVFVYFDKMTVPKFSTLDSVLD
ncbi:MAG: hypothetical protein JSS66_06230 [Armatimonadetes bacterium]|nr:hypothetical protein [Armatimonadota bacterium]